MLIKHYKDVERIKIEKEGFKGVFAYFCLTKEDGCPRYAMRVFEFEPGGYTSFHNHLEEHEMFFLEGSPGYVDKEKNEIKLKPGDVLYIPPEEMHQIKNLGNTIMRMICTIPILPGGDGKKSTKIKV